MENAKEFFKYKDRPLVRSGNTLYYGDLNEDYVVMIQVMDTKPFQDMTISNKVIVQLMLTDPEVRMRDRFLKKAEKEGLWNALDVGAIWLQRALDKDKK